MKSPELCVGGVLMFFMGLFVFYLEAFLDGEEEKTKVDHETPRETFKRGLVNKYTNM